MKQRKKYYFIDLVVLLGLLGLLVTGCTKMNKTYYHYDNEKSSFEGDAIQYLHAQNGIYDSMLLAIDQVTGLEDSIKAGDITLFAMTNASFTLALTNLNEIRARNIPPRAPLSIAQLDSAQLDTLMCRYVVRGIYTADSISTFADGLTVSSIRYNYLMQLEYKHNSSSGYVGGGPEYLIYSDRNESIFDRYWVSANTNAIDIRTENSIIHMLSPGHGFGFGQIVERMNVK